jgi:hypothetical protein
MMEAARTSERLVNFYQTTRCYNPEDSHLYALSGIRTHDPSNQPGKTHASGRAATVTGNNILGCDNLKERFLSFPRAVYNQP